MLQDHVVNTPKTSHSIFVEWCDYLENQPDQWGVRRFAAGGGTVWRNRAMREFFSPLGILPSPTLAWNVARTYLPASDLQLLRAAYRCAFLGRLAVAYFDVVVPAAVIRAVITFRAVQGNLRHGVIITHLLPVSAATCSLCANWRPALLE